MKKLLTGICLKPMLLVTVLNVIVTGNNNNNNNGLCIFLKNLDRGPGPEREVLPEITFYFLLAMLRGLLDPRPVLELRSLAVRAWSPNH